jgi:hypothetical protein
VEVIMQLWNRLLTSCAAVLLLGFIAGAAHATSMGGCPGSGRQGDVFNLGEVESGGLLFHDFRFYSPACSVDPNDLEVDIVGRDVTITGDITLTDRHWAKFYLSYEVTVVDPDENLLINGASLELDSSFDAPRAAVFATKHLIGGRPDKPDEHPWRDHGRGPLGWGLLHELEGHGYLQSKTLAFLEAAEWSGQRGRFCNLGWDEFCSGEIEFDERSFDPQESVKVIDGVKIDAQRGSQVEFVSTNSFSVVPEPATAAMLALGLFGLAFGGRRL